MSESLNAALASAEAAASVVVETDTLVFGDSVSNGGERRVVAVQVPITEWDRLVVAVRDGPRL